MDAQRRATLERALEEARKRPIREREPFLADSLSSDPELLERALADVGDPGQRGRQRVAALGERLRKIMSSEDRGSPQPTSEASERPPAASPPGNSPGNSPGTSPAQPAHSSRSPRQRNNPIVERLQDRAPAEARYRVEGALGEDATGRLYRVTDEDLERNLAMKVALAPSGADRLLREARITSWLDHPGVPPVHDLGLDGEGRLYFTTSRPVGVTLTESMRRMTEGDPEWSRSRVTRVLLQAAETVAFAHARGVGHGSLSTDVIIAGEHGATTVLRWEQARPLANARRTNGTKAAGPGEDVEFFLSTLEQLVEPESALETTMRRLSPHEGRPPPTMADFCGALTDEFDLERELPEKRSRWAAVLSAVVAASLVAGSWGAYEVLVRTERIGQSAAASEGAVSVRSMDVRVTELTDALRVKQLLQDASRLWPASPERVAAMEGWLKDAEPFAGRSSPGSAPQEGALAMVASDLDALCARDGVIDEVRQGLAFARTIRDRSIVSARADWDAAIESIGDEAECPAYGGLRLSPQLGFVPLGRNAESGWWEFELLQPAANQDSDAWVFMLVPGNADVPPFFASFSSGTSTHANDLDRRVRLGLDWPTQAQWRRLMEAGVLDTEAAEPPVVRGVEPADD